MMAKLQVADEGVCSTVSRRCYIRCFAAVALRLQLPIEMLCCGVRLLRDTNQCLITMKSDLLFLFFVKFCANNMRTLLVCKVSEYFEFSPRIIGSDG